MTAWGWAVVGLVSGLALAIVALASGWGLAALVLKVRARLRWRVPSGRPSATDGEVGWCGDVLWLTLVQGEQPPVCSLPSGHDGWHRDGDCNWGAVPRGRTQDQAREAAAFSLLRWLASRNHIVAHRDIVGEAHLRVGVQQIPDIVEDWLRATS